MIILDTNVVSELTKSLPDHQVKKWFGGQPLAQLFITSITIAEISYGLHRLPEGKRRAALEAAFNVSVVEAFKYRILSFDETAAHLYGEIMVHRKQLGRPLDVADGQIAAITLSKKATLVTRNVKDFANCGLELINPFE